MPVLDPECPEVLKEALEDMEAKVQSFKESLSFAAPETHSFHWADLQQGLAGTISNLYEEAQE